LQGRDARGKTRWDYFFTSVSPARGVRGIECLFKKPYLRSKTILFFVVEPQNQQIVMDFIVLAAKSQSFSAQETTQTGGHNLRISINVQKTNYWILTFLVFRCPIPVAARCAVLFGVFM
jgi:hypothetical protein